MIVWKLLGLYRRLIRWLDIIRRLIFYIIIISIILINIAICIAISIISRRSISSIYIRRSIVFIRRLILSSIGICATLINIILSLWSWRRRILIVWNWWSLLIISSWRRRRRIRNNLLHIWSSIWKLRPTINYCIWWRRWIIWRLLPIWWRWIIWLRR